MAVTIASLAVINLLVWWRLHNAHPIFKAEILLHLAIDVAALAGLLYFSGGSTNPLGVGLLLIMKSMS